MSEVQSFVNSCETKKKIIEEFYTCFLIPFRRTTESKWASSSYSNDFYSNRKLIFALKLRLRKKKEVSYIHLLENFIKRKLRQIILTIHHQWWVCLFIYSLNYDNKWLSNEGSSFFLLKTTMRRRNV
jgi:hypothetical protein